jgi:hypothetical protein
MVCLGGGSESLTPSVSRLEEDSYTKEAKCICFQYEGNKIVKMGLRRQNCKNGNEFG